MAEKADQGQIAPRKWPPAIKAALRALGRSEHRIFSLPPGVTVEVVRDLDAAGLVEFRLFALYPLGDIRFKKPSTDPVDWKIDPYPAWFSPAHSKGGVLAAPGDDEFEPLFNPDRNKHHYPAPVREAYREELVPLVRLTTRGKTELLHLEAEATEAANSDVAGDSVKPIGMGDQIPGGSMQPVLSAVPAIPRTEPSRPDAQGFVESPPDSSAYVPAAVVKNDYSPPELSLTDRKLTALVKDFATNRIRWSRPIGRDGKIRTNRLLIHLGDWNRFVHTMFPSKQNPTVEEIERQKAEIRARSNPKR